MHIRSVANTAQKAVNKTKSGTDSYLAPVLNPYAPPTTPNSKKDKQKKITPYLASLCLAVTTLLALNVGKGNADFKLDLEIAPAAGGPPQAYPKKINEDGKRVTNPLYDPDFGRVKLIHKTMS